ncbi:MAG TPA: RtcB family protein [Candidatus Omnitrophota bacterium]|nr:RtcB family protein [Candidatus Omnitrophota bacterium]
MKSEGKKMKGKKIYDYSINPDEETERQFRECYSQDFVVSAALMPDAHRGYVAPIGAVLVTKGYIVPAWVGYDIGCGMIAVKISGKNILEKIKARADVIYDAVKKAVPMGLGVVNKMHTVSNENKEKFNQLLEKFKANPHDNEVYQFIKSVGLRDLGTLGAGNHFISINEEENQKSNDFVWLIIHCGSRGLGHRVAKKYMIKTSGSEENFEATFPLKADSEIGKEYLNLLDFGLEYALLNRMEVSRRVIDALSAILREKLTSSLWVNKNHNHAILEKGKFIHRKGATPAKKGERGIIPGNMRDGSFLVTGLGNPKFLNSSSHGAGRAMSRTQAKREISTDEMKKEMKGIKTNLVIEEAPKAYKNIFEVMEKQKQSVKVVKHLKPLINWQEPSGHVSDD